jgi:thiol-disulfide isomerase/thioredoxin
MEPEVKTNFVMNHIMSNKWIYIGLIIVVIIGVVFFVYPKLTERFINKKMESVDKILEEMEQITPGKVSLVVCYAPWCGYTKRFMGMSQPDEREYQFTYQNPAIFKNVKDGKKVSDWEVLKNAFTGTDVNIVEIDFEEPSSHSKEQIVINGLKGDDVKLEGFPTIYLKIGDTYTRFSENRRADEIAKWMDRIIGEDHKYETILRDSLEKNGFEKLVASSDELK